MGTFDDDRLIVIRSLAGNQLETKRQKQQKLTVNDFFSKTAQRLPPSKLILALVVARETPFKSLVSPSGTTFLYKLGPNLR